MIGVVVGIFCALCVAGLCSYFFKLDVEWWFSLNKPSFVVSGGWFTAFVFVSYLSSVLSITKLVEHKHIFPSMIFFLILGIFCVLFVVFMFTLKILAAAMFCITVVLSMSYVLFVRFMIKDFKIAMVYFPSLVFYIYGFLCVVCIALAN